MLDLCCPKKNKINLNVTGDDQFLFENAADNFFLFEYIRTPLTVERTQQRAAFKIDFQAGERERERTDDGCCVGRGFQSINLKRERVKTQGNKT